MATIKAVNGRTLTVEENGNTADYVILRDAKICLNDRPCKLADLDNGDEVEIGGTTPNGSKSVVATRTGDQRPESVRPSTTSHFPPVEGEISQREGDKLRRTSTMPNPEERQKAEKKIQHSNEVRGQVDQEQIKKAQEKQTGIKQQGDTSEPDSEERGAEPDMDLSPDGDGDSPDTVEEVQTDAPPEPLARRRRK